MEIQFYTISEDMARAANDANSMSDYKQGQRNRGIPQASGECLCGC